MPQVQVGHSIWSGALFDYWMLTKPEINFLIAITTAAAFYLGCEASIVHFPWTPLVDTVLGTVLVASGANTLNQLIERNFDAKMRRTARRPILATVVIGGLLTATLLTLYVLPLLYPYFSISVQQGGLGGNTEASELEDSFGRAKSLDLTHIQHV